MKQLARLTWICVLPALGCNDRYHVGAYPPLVTCPSDARPASAVSVLGNDERSHWLERWKLGVRTLPVSRLREALGIGLWNTAESIASVPQLANAGFSRVNVETVWSQFGAEDGTRFDAESGARIAALLAALAESGMRPKIWISVSGVRSAPGTSLRLELTALAPAGSSELQVTAESFAAAIDRRTVLFQDAAPPALVVEHRAPSTLVLSRALARDLDARSHAAYTLKLEPMGEPGGPAQRANVSAFLQYASAAATLARDAVGASSFDVDLALGADPLFDARAFFDPPPPATDTRAAENRALLAAAVVQMLEEPANGFGNPTIVSVNPEVRELGAVAGMEIGVSALDFDAAPGFSARSVDALGNDNGGVDLDGRWREALTPSYRAYLPELSLTALSESSRAWEQLQQSAGSPPWILGWSLGTLDWSVKPRAVLRGLIAHVAQGAGAFYLFVPLDDEAYSVIEPEIQSGGAVLEALSRLMRELDGTNEDLSSAGEFELLDVRSCSTAVVFEGDGSAAHPTVYHRDITAFLPFRVRATEFLAAVYVMTRDVAVTPDELRAPGELTTLIVRAPLQGMVDAEIYDPLSNARRSVPIRALAGGTFELTLPLTDAPQLLRVRQR